MSCTILQLFFRGIVLHFLILSMRTNAVHSQEKSTIHIMAIYSTKGTWANISDYQTLLPHWENYLRNKLNGDPTWPLNIVVESWDVMSNVSYIKEIMGNRLSSKVLPAVMAIIGEGDDGYPGSMIARIAAEFQIPCIITALSPDLHSKEYKLPPEQNTSYLMIGSTVRVFGQAIETYLTQGAKTVVAVANARYDMYNNHSCYDTADIMVQRGIKILAKFMINEDEDRSKVVEIIGKIVDLDPDVVLWCDWSACANPADTYEFLPLKFFKEANYLPKALTMLDCLGIIKPTIEEEYLFQFVSGPSYTNVQIKGFDYVEDATPFSSLFRPVTPIPFTAIDYNIIGTTEDMPSSATLFGKWYFNQTGQQPSYYTVSLWGAFDVLEKVLYLATQQTSILRGGLCMCIYVHIFPFIHV